MDKKQVTTMRAFGYAIETLPGRTIPKMTYYKNGETFPNAPADPYHMERYLKRGFTLTPQKPEIVGAVEIAVAPTIKRTYRRRKK